MLPDHCLLFISTFLRSIHSLFQDVSTEAVAVPVVKKKAKREEKKE
jgi:hypothetical protein